MEDKAEAMKSCGWNAHITHETVRLVNNPQQNKQVVLIQAYKYDLDITEKNRTLILKYVLSSYLKLLTCFRYLATFIIIFGTFHLHI